MIHLACACGADLQVDEVYAGGQILCSECGSPVLVPAADPLEDRFRFHCPHCEARVLARKRSAGKKSQCPACGKVYVVPTPPSDADSYFGKEPGHRVTLEAGDLPTGRGLPFRVGVRPRPSTQQPPQARYVHTPDEVDRAGVTSPQMPIPVGNTPHAGSAAPGADLPASATMILAPDDVARRSQNAQDTTMIAATAPREFQQQFPASAAAQPPRIATVAQPPRTATEPDVLRPPFFWKQASSGELCVISGHADAQRIRLDFHHFMVGVERDCNLRPASPLVSRHHCVFKKDEYALRVRDLGSKLGTYVNGRRISNEIILNPGDAVTVGDVTLHVFLPHSPHVTHSKADSNPSISDFVIL